MTDGVALATRPPLHLAVYKLLEPCTVKKLSFTQTKFHYTRQEDARKSQPHSIMGYYGEESKYTQMANYEQRPDNINQEYHRQYQLPQHHPTPLSQPHPSMSKDLPPGESAGAPMAGSNEESPIYGNQGTVTQNTVLNYESVVGFNDVNTFGGASTIRGGRLPNHQMTVTSLSSTTPAGKIRKMKKSAKRLIFKDGNCNVAHCNIQERRRKYLADLFTTLIDIRWRWSFFIFFSSFVFR